MRVCYDQYRGALILIIDPVFINMQIFQLSGKNDNGKVQDFFFHMEKGIKLFHMFSKHDKTGRGFVVESQK